VTRQVAASSEELLRTGLLQPWVPAVGDRDGDGGDDARQRAAKLTGTSCGVGASGLVVLPNGDLIPCTDTMVPLGNLTRRSFREVLAESPELEMFRTLSWRDVHGGRDCDLLMACHRGHATAMHEGGDYLGPYPGACARARARYAAGVGVTELEVLAPAAGCDPGRAGAI